MSQDVSCSRISVEEVTGAPAAAAEVIISENSAEADRHSDGTGQQVGEIAEESGDVIILEIPEERKEAFVINNEEQQTTPGFTEEHISFIPATSAGTSSATASSTTVFQSPKRRRIASPKHNKGLDDETNKTAAAATVADEDEETCPICFDMWTTSGAHRLVALKCGHIFGQSCIEKWLHGHNAKCPQCNAKAKKGDIRPIFAKSLKVIDTTERDSTLKQLQKEQQDRVLAETAAAQVRFQYQLAIADCNKLKRELESQKKLIEALRKQVIETPSSRPSQGFPRSQGSRSGGFVPIGHINIWEGGNCRVLSYSSSLATAIVSQPSNNNLFPGYGIRKVSAMDFKTTEYLPAHSKAIRDVCFHHSINDSLLLSCALDKTVKLSNMITNSIVQTYDVPHAAWSCIWKTDDEHCFYSGMQNGLVLEFDIRNTNSHVQQLNAQGSKSPVVSLQYIPPSLMSTFRTGGLLVGQLDKISFYEKQQCGQHRLHFLPLQGNLTSLCFESETRHLLSSFRPSGKYPTVRHQMCEMTESNISIDPACPDTHCSCNVVHTVKGGMSQTILTKSILVPQPGDSSHLFICAGDEASGKVHIWDTTNFSLHQKISCNSAILDLCSVSVNSNHYLLALTDKLLMINKWQDSPVHTEY